MSDEEVATRTADPGETRQQRDTTETDASPDIHCHSPVAGEESKLFDSELPLVERQKVGAAAPVQQWAADISSSPYTAVRMPATLSVPPNTAPLSMPDIRNHENLEEGKENSSVRLGTIRQCATTMHAHVTVRAEASEGKSASVPDDRAAWSQPLCSDTGSSQHEDVDSGLGATGTGLQARPQQAQSYNHDSSADTPIAVLALHGQNSNKPRSGELFVTADLTMQSSSDPAASRSRPVGSIALAPRHPAKAIWLGFVRRAYRKFGKDMLSTVDLRWKMTGASELAAAWRRTDAARKIAAANHTTAYPPNVAAAAGGVGLGQASTASTSVGCLPPSTSASSPYMSDAAVASMFGIDTQQEVRASVRRSLPSCIRASAGVQLRQALTNMIQAGDGGSRGQNWVLTWPSGMVEFDMSQLVLLRRDAALHRSRNTRPKSIVHVAPLQSESESSRTQQLPLWMTPFLLDTTSLLGPPLGLLTRSPGATPDITSRGAMWTR